ncbi:PAAR domain-containing protein [Massilia horti]|uniref:PAAR domain-containing protein n=1 Tax=Massilia horti TaxID=2562153 RepID=A0A4Y9T627_9BURK|nr:PAAR domain-containing protein [Massilia horti]TFW33585.1 PAAR domain-containing protein [Massilia horti]
MKNVIRLGDATSHGGKVISTGATNFRVHGVPVACVGDRCSCPIPGHTECTITTGSHHHIINGKRIAFDGDSLSCGAKLISSLKHFSTTM